MAERSKAAVLKTVESSRAPGVRIPLSPNIIVLKDANFAKFEIARRDQAQNKVVEVFNQGRSFDKDIISR